ncbi:LTA synthase family protein [Campylobacter upsaliensis]|uniref:LTA synthase family protein n=1 Tax=Campylobacter upsaliensis TaxID=28080 RepID=UPI0022EA7259|nr:sulfatase-like hydrolase/transferase [Campylobacter upsaliensis]
MRKVLLQILIFSAIFIVISNLTRVLMHLAFIPQSADKIELLKMYLFGSYHDVRFLSAAFLPLLLCGVLSYFAPLLKIKGGGGVRVQIVKFYSIFSSFYIALIALLCVAFSFIKYYYYEMYKSKIDVFIFSVQNEEFGTIFKIIYADYPIIFALLALVLAVGVCVFINYKVLKISLKPLRLNVFIVIFLNFILIGIYVLALRGPYHQILMNERNYRFANLEVINDIALNPIMAFSWARKASKELQKLPYISEEEGQVLQKELFSLFATTPYNPQNKPHIFVNLMESFANNALEFHSLELNLLGELEKHFKEDFVFERFLSSGNGTAPSLFYLYFNSPIILTKSKYFKTNLTQNPTEPFTKQGYEVIFITSGNRSWFELGTFLEGQKIKLIDSISLLKDYPNAQKTAYGILDEYMYYKAYELFKGAEKPLLIIALSTSNHPPYPKVYESISKANLNGKINEKLPKNTYENLNNYAYANSEFGKFVSKIKASDLKDKIIIAATGDHRVRDMKIDPLREKAFAYSVPFYLYVPKNYQKNLYYDKYRLASHKDIFPTLYELSLSEATYYSLGGRNLLAAPSDEKLEFAFNEVVWADNFGVYPLENTKGYFYENNTTLKDTNEAFELDDYHKKFANSYRSLMFYQLSLRLKDDI